VTGDHTSQRPILLKFSFDVILIELSPALIKRLTKRNKLIAKKLICSDLLLHLSIFYILVLASYVVLRG